ncbi:MAG: endolytic transglycosylase MltG [Ectothiorhodospiraceae bacterium]|nr:endolytic transglycosylase MltG [Paracoccaceae bacterium]MCH8503714.1 endolytic transglycosylase MltG [Ectothiorhodospiraceae bacterium]
MIRKLGKLLFVSFVLACIAAGVLYLDYQRWLESSVHEREDPLYVDVPPGTSFRALVGQLEREGLVDRPRYFEFMARQSGQAGRIQAGEYNVPAGATPPDLLRQLVEGRVIQYRFTLIEGWTFRQLRTALEADPRIVNTLDGQDDEAVMERLGRADTHPEGWFYPETYSFTRGTTDEQILRRALTAMEGQLERIWEQRHEGIPLEDPYEALILASIIERETGQPHERGKVAGVFTRRLELGMRLQTDPTVIYGMGDSYDGRIRTRDLRTDTPYNTYTRHGLPPTPIAMPSGAAIAAAVNPEPGDALYFVSRGDGSHHFSATLEEHNRAVRRYILGRDD